ncbi:hypothetical protein G6F46_006206 [Rhizopus delemar]|uniref:Mitochondrial carrier n=2 Tax=Rhizopus TaxID=4842 RepID=A0A9P7CPG0_9FUNG|nr:hypothetical protein G6F55_007974 [Rhizopus delemar]KAG1544089.1 hypothetical protein G6F51_006279 [Rhizopus arrhizus]KAG1497936.1 hypothetical protein G6F54_005423 [Rhizopus delemar]KAG1511628.1 hypothetical protein G6F53_005797 [Rhizopus delemar]KAG1522861.1 hypothetical protein G6F52_005497 [Rhizopus delemar]
MTLSAYLGLLSIGSTIQIRSTAENQEEEEREVQHLRRLSEAIADAEIDIVSTISTYHAPLEHKEVKENISGVILAIGSMIANYTLCFPIVAARHSLQALPVKNSFQRDTPSYGAAKLYYAYRNGGIRKLYPGFGLGLLGQAISASYESFLGQIMSAFSAFAIKINFPLYAITKITAKLLALAINAPLYPLYRNALILRVQTDSDISRIVIRNYYDFFHMYKQNLMCFRSFRTIHPAFIPSCILNILTENLLVYIYRHIFKSFTAQESSAAKKNNSTTSSKKDSTVLHTFYPEIACGVISSIITRTASYPVDTILFKLMVQDSGLLKVNTNYKGFFDCIKRTYIEEGGWKAFYPGWGIGVLEIGMGYFVLEASWLAYRGMQWCLSSAYDNDNNTRTVKKARKLRERLL